MSQGNAYNLSANLAIQRITVNPKTIADFQKRLGRTKVSVHIDLRTKQLEKQLTALETRMKKVSSASVGMAAANTKVATSQDRVTNSINRQLSARAQSNRLYSIQLRDVATLTGSLISLHSAYTKVTQGMRAFMEVQQSVSRVAQISGTNIDAPVNQQFAKEVRRVSKMLGVSSSDLASSAADLRQSGLDMASVTKQIETLGKLNLNAQINDIGLMAEQIIILKAAFSQGDAEVERSLSKTIALSKQFAVGAEDNRYQ